MTANCWRYNSRLWPFRFSTDALSQRLPLMAPVVLLLMLLMTSIVGPVDGRQVYEDCEQPPEVAHGSARLTVDQSEEFVTAHYSCDRGFRIDGPVDIRCDIDSDEWQVNQLPKCVEESTDDGTSSSSSSSQQQKKRKNARGQNIQEETAVSSAFAVQLDLSCMAQGLIHAPEIDNGYVVKYNRRKKDDHIFLVAFYECDDRYELQPAEMDRLFCSGKQWIGTKPSCVSNRPEGEEDEDEEEDYDDEEEEAEEEEEEEAEEEQSGGVQEAPKHEMLPETTPSVVDDDFGGKVDETESELRPAGEHEPVDETKDADYDQNHNEEDGHVIESELPEKTAHQTIPAASASTTTMAPEEEITIKQPNCGSDRGGCDHECQMVYSENEVQPTVQCSCFEGFELDLQDRRTCRDINECEQDNGGCGQTCTNKPGSFECTCQSGLQIDVLDGRSCIDIDECEDAARCSYGCENTHGSYRCLTAPEPGSSPSPSLSSSSEITSLTDGEDDEQEEEREDEDGFDEEADNENGNEEPAGAEQRPSTVTSTTTTTEANEIDKKSDEDEYGEGVEQQSNNEILPPESDDVGDDNEKEDDRLNHELPSPSQIPEIDRSNIEKLGQSFDTTNQVDDGDDEYDYKENDDDDDDDDRQRNKVESHHQDTHHPHRHHHGDQIDEPEESETDQAEFGPHSFSTEPSSVTTDNEDEEDEYEEGSRGESELDSDDYFGPGSEISSSSSTTTTSPRPVVSCREGLRLNSADVCEDIDECAEQDHGCDYCRNAYGGYECFCPTGYELADDDKSCQDVDECENHEGLAAEDWNSVGICSHECHNTVGSYECRCPDNFHLNTDRRTCVRDFCADLYENPNKTRCSHECKDGTEGFICVCPEFHILDEFDRKTCQNVYSCGGELKKRCEPGVCRVLAGGDYRCECPQGYQQDDHSCHDLDECELGRHMCSHDCFNTAGSYRCDCPHGLRLSTDNRTCDDVDECQQHQDSYEICGDLQCLNTYGSYKCVCAEGKELDEYGICRQMDLCTTDNGGCSHICTFFNRETFCDCPDEMELADDGKTCVVFNECERNNGGCSHICDPHADVLCKCPEGFSLAGDMRNCQDINECSEENGKCEQRCINLPGSFECGCFDGFEISRENNRSCSDINECLLNHGHCDQQCRNTEGSFHCSCNEGYQLVENGRSCEDIDECEVNNGRCSHTCLNLLGSYQCSCPEGLYLTEDKHLCDFIDECELNNGGCSHDCHYHRGVITCSCPGGFELERENFKTCVDTNECNNSNGGCSHICSNLPGSYLCSCPEGFELSRNSHTCDDIDECIENNGNCSNICINLLGEYRCACEAGFELEDDRQTCRDVDECSTKIHDCSHICVNVPGTFECECPTGYRLGRDKFTCEDINECETLPESAGCEHHCINTHGSYRCGCEDGHRLEPDNRTCSDIDECSDEQKRCSHDCLNTKGGFKCSCPVGLRLDVDEVSCLDIDECKINNFNGGCSHICLNEHGSFRCSCPEGWVLGDDDATCVDIDECTNLNGGCSQRCLNYRGGYKCECNSGFALMADNKTCEVSNPCALRNGGCEHFCSIKKGNTVCSCREGYTLNKTNLASCVDHDECQLPGDNNCQQKCVNTEGGYRCECYLGHEKNALGQCIDINECLEMNGGCGSNARCINLAGSFRCLCPPGFKLGNDRRNCLAIRNRCQPLTAPNNGEINCSRSRHRSQFFYKTKCSIRCNTGYKLVGPAVRQCNGTGIWDEGESLCIPQSCPRLPRPEHGTILPVACTNGKIYPGERCVLHCKPGFKPSDKRAVLCDTTQSWTPSVDLQCIPATTPQPVVPIKPYIQCPPDVHDILPVGQYTMRVRLEQPKSNVDWHKYIDSHPAWGKQLETELPAGETSMTFRARSPNSNMNDICRVLIRIRERRPPQVVNCPESFNVQLEGPETSRSVFWVEPHFETDNEIKQLYKSHTPGQLLIAGVHYVNYVATDADGLSAKCSFGITVKASPDSSSFRRPMHRPHETNRLENHESFLICPGKSPIRVDASDPDLYYRRYSWYRSVQSNQVQLQSLHIPQGCVVKNVRVRQKLARLRHQQHVLQRHLQELERAPNPDQMAIEQQHRRYNNLLRYYSSWDNAVSHHQRDDYGGQPQRHPRRWFEKRSKDSTSADGEKP
ncbi:fibrillin-1 isoform X2 [Wyeomyia smithii]|uniref:fibrillin-1 isoform X2 n=1 Tax=Wyeomyia smithii TaxID=174621 RepID=UPI0024680580|nr:fibrillin-1 isoform X2 [Wyeomyia smithii]